MGTLYRAHDPRIGRYGPHRTPSRRCRISRYGFRGTCFVRGRAR